MKLMKSKPKNQYQADTREFVRELPKIGLFIYFGGGKTYQVLQWLSDRIDAGQDMLPAIVLCPANLTAQWGDQIEMHTHFTYSVVDGSLRERRELLSLFRHIYVVNYGAMRTALRKDLNILAAQAQTIICDESTYIKNGETSRFKNIQYNFIAVPNRAILGKPITEEAQNLWSQMMFLDDGKRLGRTWWGYIKRFFTPDPFKMFKQKLNEGAAQEIADAVKDICVYVPREKVAEQLPPRTIIPVYFDMPAEVRKKYDELRRNFRLEFESGAVVDTQWAMVKSAKLHQMCQGFVYAKDEDEGRVVEDFDCDKFAWLEDAVPEILVQGPLIIWAYHKETVRAICAILSEMKIEFGRYMGGDTQDEVEEFKSGSTPLSTLVLSTSAAFGGLNLYRAKSAIFFSQGYSGDQRENALHRNYRMGSEIHDQIIVYDCLVKNSIDTVVYDALAAKADVSDAILKHLIQEV